MVEKAWFVRRRGKRTIMPEKVRRWKPIEGIKGRYCIECIANSVEGFKIILLKQQEKDTKVHILLESWPDLYKITNESFKQEEFIFLDSDEDATLYFPWRFYIVEDSSYIKLMSQESYTWSRTTSD
jgi:hypothetical protein